MALIMQELHIILINHIKQQIKKREKDDRSHSFLAGHRSDNIKKSVKQQ